MGTTIYHVQRLIITGHRSYPTDTDSPIRPCRKSSLLTCTPAAFPCQSRDHIHSFTRSAFFSSPLHGIAKEDSSFSSPSSYNHVVKQQNISFRHISSIDLLLYIDFLRLVTYQESVEQHLSETDKKKFSTSVTKFHCPPFS